jgi:uncharacterized protein
LPLMIFTRYPIQGSVKTRLIPLLGDSGACILHQKMVLHTLEKLDPFSSLQIWYEGAGEIEMRKWLGCKYIYKQQTQGDLGERMLHAFREAFAAGETKALLVGTDCPGITLMHVEEALLKLDQSDVVVGPAKDGGYYLIGMKAAHEDLFRAVPWGTDQVFQITEERARKERLEISLLEELADVDRPEDVAVWYHFAQK